MLKMRNLASSIAVAGKAGKWERFMVVTKAGRTREMLCNSDLSRNCLEYEVKIVKIGKASPLWPAEEENDLTRKWMPQFREDSEVIICRANTFLEIS